MSDYITFTDPVFLARFGLNRTNALDYFLLPLNPFRTPNNTSNETLSMQGTTIGLLVQQGHMYHRQHVFGNVAGGMTLQEAEAEYHKALTKLTGEQYELLPPVDQAMYDQPQNLFTIRHVLRSSPTSTKILGVYYIVEGVIYKSPTIRSLMKSNVARVLDALSNASSTLSVCARYLPSTGYTWRFEGDEDDDDDDDGHDAGDVAKNSTGRDVSGGGDGDKQQTRQRLSNEENPVTLIKSIKRQKRRRILDNRPIGERSEAEEEGLRATQAMDQILVRLNKSPFVAAEPSSSSAGALLSSKKNASSLLVLSSTLKSDSATGGATKTKDGKRTRNERDDDDVVSVAEPPGSANSSTTGVLSTK